MAQYTMDQFLQQTAQREQNQGVFELERDRVLEVHLNGRVWMKAGVMIAYRGQIKFTREGMLDRGLGNLLKKAVSGEGTALTKAEGQGRVYLADTGKKVSILQLAPGEVLCVNGNDILAFEETVQYDIRMMRKVAAMMAGGLFSVVLTGPGLIAFTTHYDPVALEVRPDHPLVTDPNATVAWSGTLEPQFRTDVSFKTFLGRGSGESIQMAWQGSGFVIIQPYEEVAMQHGQGG